MTGRLIQAGEPPARASVAVVGGGMAGLEVARELERNGVEDVLVLEAGPARDMVHMNASHERREALRAWLQPQADRYFHRPWTSLSEPHYTANSGLRRRLGGRSLYWHGVTLPIEAWALREPWWPADVVADLCVSWRDGPSLYQRLDRQLGHWRAAATDGTRLAPARAGGFTLLPTPRAVRPGQPDSSRWAAYSPLDAWLSAAPALGADQPSTTRFCCRAEVLGILVRDRAVRGLLIQHSGVQFRVAADAVILCAGTIENTRLAIQARAAAWPAAPPRMAGLVDHLVQGFVVTLPTGADPGFSPGFYVMPCPDEVKSNLFVDLRTTPAGDLELEVWTTGEQSRNDDSVVECRPADSYPWPTIVRTALSAEDRSVIAAQRTVLDEFWRSFAGEHGWPCAELDFEDFGRPTRTNQYLLPEAHTGIRVPVTWSSPLGTEDHEGGTLPLGVVLDQRHEFLDVRGLYAAGPATFPRMGAANPSLTILALAHRLAALLG
jgi:choline dehydrogenase-like flavoprotein